MPGRFAASETTRRHFVAGAAATAMLAATTPVRADDWPKQPVRVLVGFAAGGNIDNVARVTCARLSSVLGQQFVVENRVGAMGSIAADAVARAAPDGYMFFWAGTGTVSIFPAMGKPPYDPDKDFAPVGMIASGPHVLIVNNEFPAKTIGEFIAAVKAQPGKLPYAGGGGPGSVSNLVMSLFLKRADLDMIPVSYRGTAPALTDLIGGRIPAMFIPLPEALAQAQGGKLRILGVSSATRARHVPDVPTIAESGFPGFDIVSWNGLLAPAGTPKAAIDHLAAAMKQVPANAGLATKWTQYGGELVCNTPAEFAAFIKKDGAMWGKIISQAGVRLD